MQRQCSLLLCMYIVFGCNTGWIHKISTWWTHIKQITVWLKRVLRRRGQRYKKVRTLKYVRRWRFRSVDAWLHPSLRTSSHHDGSRYAHSPLTSPLTSLTLTHAQGATYWKLSRTSSIEKYVQSAPNCIVLDKIAKDKKSGWCYLKVPLSFLPSFLVPASLFFLPLRSFPTPPTMQPYRNTNIHTIKLLKEKVPACIRRHVRSTNGRSDIW